MGNLWETYEGSLRGIIKIPCFNMIITCQNMFCHVYLVMVGGMGMNGLREGDV